MARRAGTAPVGLLSKEELTRADGVPGIAAEYARDLVSAGRMVGRQPRDEDARLRVVEACDRLHDQLSVELGRVDDANRSLGVAVRQLAWPVLGGSNSIRRALEKPAGHPGDFTLMNMVYDGRPTGRDEVGRVVDGWAQALPISEALRIRRATLRRWIAASAERSVGVAVNVTSIGCGPAIEIFDAADRDGIDLDATLVDFDPAALRHVRRTASRHGSRARISTVGIGVGDLISGRARFDVAPQHLIYSMGLADYFSDATVRRLIDWAADRLAPGGRLLIGNMANGNHAAFMDHIVDWELVYRTRKRLVRIATEASHPFASIRTETDATGIQLLLICET